MSTKVRGWGRRLEPFEQKAALWLGRLARKLPYFRSRPFARMSEVLEHRPEPGLYGQGSKPEALRFCLLEFTVVSLFLTEDMRRLRDGVRSLKASHTNSFEIFGPDRMDPWFDAHRAAGPGWVNCGVLSFAGDGLGELVSSVWLHLYRVSPSIACLGATARPSANFAKRLNSILVDDYEPRERLRLARSDSGRRKWYGEIWRPSDLRRRALDDLMMEVNEHLTRLVRRHVNAGWSAGGLLPAVEVFGHWSTEEELDGLSRDFWGSVGMRREDPFNYFREDGILLFAEELRTEPRPYSRHLLLVNVPKLLEGKDLAGYPDEDTAISMTLFDRVGHLPVTIALHEHTKRIEDAAGRMRAQLAPQLSRSSGFGRPHLRRPRAFFHVQELNRLEFERTRVEAEVDWSAINTITRYELRHFTRKGFGDEGERVRFVDDLTHGFERRWNHVAKQITVLREAYRSRLDYRLQQVMTWLTVVGVVLAIPEALRVKVAAWIFDLFRSVIHLVRG